MLPVHKSSESHPMIGLLKSINNREHANALVFSTPLINVANSFHILDVTYVLKEFKTREKVGRCFILSNWKYLKMSNAGFD